MSEFETIEYDERDGVAWITLNRPQVLNAFDNTMCHELQQVWRSMRVNDDVRCAVLTGSGERAFCVGVDRKADDTYLVFEQDTFYGTSNNFMYDDPGDKLGPKANDLWKPVICAVNGMACGGAFYMLGEVEFIIASDNATIFDPHVTHGMPCIFEPMLMLQRMPLGEIMRLSLLGKHERMSAKRAHEIGLVQEVVPLEGLMDAARWSAEVIASAPDQGAIESTVRAIWAAQHMSIQQAFHSAPLYINVVDGASKDSSRGNELRQKKIESRIR